MSFHKFIQLFSYSLFCTCLISCDPGKIYENNVVIPSKGWHRAEPVQFGIEIADTTQPCDIYINVRNNIHYKYMELWLFVDIHAPTGMMARDTVKIQMADHRGKWLGHGLGSKFDTRMVFRKNMRFPSSGKYIFVYEQATRDELLTGIEDIGLRIEKNTTK